MSKPVFKAKNIETLTRKVSLDVPILHVEKMQAEEKEEVYQGPTIEEIEAEIQEKKDRAETELAEIRKEAEKEYDKIIQDAENNAFDRLKKATDEAKQKIREAEITASQKISDADIKAKEMLMESQSEISLIETKARDDGYDEGRNRGYDEGKTEVSRLIDSLNKIISATIDKRNWIIKNVEKQLMMIVLLISRKIIKTISEHQKGIVMNNIKEALSKVRGRTEVVIRVNIEDLELTTEHKEDFMAMVEDIRNVTILEDSTVDRGGCIIETDFGNIDARIASQFAEIEDRLKEIMPITVENEYDEGLY